MKTRVLFVVAIITMAIVTGCSVSSPEPSIDPGLFDDLDCATALEDETFEALSTRATGVDFLPERLEDKGRYYLLLRDGQIVEVHPYMVHYLEDGHPDKRYPPIIKEGDILCVSEEWTALSVFFDQDDSNTKNVLDYLSWKIKMSQTSEEIYWRWVD